MQVVPSDPRAVLSRKPYNKSLPGVQIALPAQADRPAQESVVAMTHTDLPSKLVSYTLEQLAACCAGCTARPSSRPFPAVGDYNDPH